MPWKERRVMSMKMEFVEKASRPGARMSRLCREYGISRETGYKWLNRFKKEGYDGLEERSRAPHSSPLQKAEEMVHAVLKAREAHPRWGPKKLHVLLKRRDADDAPAVSTIARILARFGKVRSRRQRRPLSAVERAPEVVANEPNDVWTVDFKGWWKSRDGSRCEPLTIRDAYSRFVLVVKVMPSTAGGPVREVFEQLFRTHGLPKAIQCDNGSPFIAMASRGGLTQLSAFWVSLGLAVVRSRPGKPQDNGAHERTHLDIAGDLELNPAENPAEQQRACDRWKQEFNHVRPHEALGGKVPADLYRRSPRRLRDVPEEFSYPSSWLTRQVDRRGGVISIEGASYFIGTALRGHTVALEQSDGLIHRIWFHTLDLGTIELAPPNRIIDAAADAVLERFANSSRPARGLVGPEDRPTGSTGPTTTTTDLSPVQGPLDSPTGGLPVPTP
jgi:putative transposase